MVTGTMLSVGQKLGVLKEIRGFDYYASLPIRKINLIIAYVTKATLTTFPSIIILFIIGRVFLKLPMKMNLSVVIVSIISGYSLSAIGAYIGIKSRDASQASIITQIVQPIIVFCSPVFIADEMLPQWLLYISYFIPTRYVASALRQGFNGLFDWFSILILLLFCLLSIWWVEKHLDWRM